MFAYILMGSHFTPNAHRAVFETDRYTDCVFTVKDFEEAKAQALYCADNGFGVIELCGAFGPDRAKEIIALTGNRIGVSYASHFPEQDALFAEFFSE